jgi:hypothetical protein
VFSIKRYILGCKHSLHVQSVNKTQSDTTNSIAENGIRWCEYAVEVITQAEYNIPEYSTNLFYEDKVRSKLYTMS